MIAKMTLCAFFGYKRIDYLLLVNNTRPITIIYVRQYTSQKYLVLSRQHPIKISNFMNAESLPLSVQQNARVFGLCILLLLPPTCIGPCGPSSGRTRYNVCVYHTQWCSSHLLSFIWFSRVIAPKDRNMQEELCNNIFQLNTRVFWWIYITDRHWQ